MASPTDDFLALYVATNAHPPAPPAAEFKAGDRVRGAASGRTGTVSAVPTDGYAEVDWDNGDKARGHMAIPFACLVSIAPPAESEFFGTQPDPLPETLPAGTKSVTGARARTELTLRPARWGGDCNAQGYWGRWENDTTDLYNTPRNIDWATTRKSPPAPSQAERIPFKVGDIVSAVLCCNKIDADIRYTVKLLDLTPDKNDWVQAAIIRGTEQSPDIWVHRSSLRPLAATPPVRDETTAAGSADATRQEVDKGQVCDPPEKAAQPAAVDPYRAHRLAVERGEVQPRKNPPRCPERQWKAPIELDGLTGDALTEAIIDNKRLAKVRAEDRRVQFAWLKRRHRDPLAVIESSGRAERAERHPSDWDVSDAPECFATSGWSGR